MEQNRSKIMHWLSRPLVAVVLLVLLGGALYAPSINGEFIFDDISNISENPMIKNWEVFSEADKAAGLRRYEDLKRRWVSYITFAANYRLGKLDTTGYHVVNVLIHVSNALLVYLLALLTFRTPFLRNSDLASRSPAIALLAASFFVAHPIQTQAVSYIVQRMTSLATLFYLTSLVCYLAFRLSGKSRRKMAFYGISIAAAVLGMKTKEIVFTLPLTVLIFELSFFSGPLKKRLAWWTPIALTMLIIPLTIISIGQSTQMDDSFRVREMSRGQYLLTEFRVLVTYLRLFVLPFNQNLDYSYPSFKSFLEPEILRSFVLLCSLAGTGVYLFIKSRAGGPGLRVIALGVAWFFLTLSVESTLVPLFVIFEHRLYLPMAGLSLGAATGAALLYHVFRGGRARRASLILALAVMLAFSAAAVARNFVWQTEVSMWSDVITKSPNKSRGHSNLGRAYRNAGMEDQAMEQFEASLQVKGSGDFVDFVERFQTYINIGNHYYNEGDNARAMEFYRRSIMIEPENHLGYFNLATVYLTQGETGKAMAELETSIEKNPGFAPAHYLKAEAYMKQDMPQEALESYRRALELDPGLGKARLGLAGVLDKMGRPGEALTQYRQAALEMPESAEAQYLLGNALRETGDFDGAGTAWFRAVELDPEHAGALNHLGGYYMLKKDYSTAVKYMTESLKHNEANAEAHYNLALALEALGNQREAAAHYRRFIELAPPEYADVVERVKQKTFGTKP